MGQPSWPQAHAPRPAHPAAPCPRGCPRTAPPAWTPSTAQSQMGGASRRSRQLPRPPAPRRPPPRGSACRRCAPQTFKPGREGREEAMQKLDQKRAPGCRQEAGGGMCCRPSDAGAGGAGGAARGAHGGRQTWTAGTRPLCWPPRLWGARLWSAHVAQAACRTRGRAAQGVGHEQLGTFFLVFQKQNPPEGLCVKVDGAVCLVAQPVNHNLLHVLHNLRDVLAAGGRGGAAGGARWISSRGASPSLWDALAAHQETASRGGGAVMRRGRHRGRGWRHPLQSPAPALHPTAAPAGGPCRARRPARRT